MNLERENAIKTRGAAFPIQSSRQFRKAFNEYTYIFYLLPALAFFGVFLIYPIFEGIHLSFYLWDGFSDKKFVGLQNFKFIFSDPNFREALYHSIQVALVAPAIQTVIGLILAICVAEVTRGKILYRVLLFFPVILSLVASTIIWSWIFAPSDGLLNKVLSLFSIPTVQWLGNVKTALSSLVTISIWRWVGFTTMVFIAGLQTINPTLREAAAVDGATRVKIYRYITIPLLGPFITINFVLNIFGYLNFFDIIFLTTKGGPGGSTQVLPIYIYLEAFNNNSFGKASAAGVILLAFAILLVLIYFRLVKRAHK